MNEDKLWSKPFATPMIEESFEFIRKIIGNYYHGSVIYAPTGTGKSSLIELMESEAKSFMGPRGNVIESTVVSVSTNERYVMSEGGFWGWLLYAFNHRKANTHMALLEMRFLVYEYLKGLAGRSQSGRVVVFIDEAQKLGLEELGLLADLLNEVAKCGFRLVVFLIGSYHLAHWQVDLQTRRHSHVRRRFFSKEHRLLGLATVEDFRRCLRRFDVDSSPFEGEKTIAEYYQPDWYHGGGRLEPYASHFRRAFGAAIGDPKTFQVPMAFFSLALQEILNQPKIQIDMRRLQAAVEESKFAKNYELDAEA